jgi:hypothetical protein
VRRSSTLIASAYFGLAVTARYALTLQVFTIASAVSLVILTILQQKMAQARVAGDQSGFLRLVEIGLAASNTFYLLIAACVITLGPTMLQRIGGRTSLLSGGTLLWLGFTVYLEMNHTASSMIILTRNVVPFVVPSILTGLGVVVLLLGGLHFFHPGIWYLVFAPFIVQLIYNNWRWPTYLASDLGIPYPRLILNGFGQAFRLVKTV